MYCRRRSIELLQLALLAGCLLYLNFPEIDKSSSFLRSSSSYAHGISRKLMTIDGKAFADESSRRKNCQIIYTLGVEGVGHRSFSPVLKRLIEHQVDAQSGLPYKYEDPRQAVVQKAIYGRNAQDSNIRDADLVHELLDAVCPNDGKYHILPLDASFPSYGYSDGHYRVERQQDWADMSMHDIAKSATALQHPVNLRAFYLTYSRYVDIKFIALSNPFVETVVAYQGLDGGPEQHMNVISGYLLLIRQFLDWTDAIQPSWMSMKKHIWTVVCMEQIKERKSPAKVEASRNEMIQSIANFLGWPKDQCDDCFDQFKDMSHTTARAERRLMARGRKDGKPHIMELLNGKLEVLESVWPPPPKKGQKQCAL